MTDCTDGSLAHGMRHRIRNMIIILKNVTFALTTDSPPACTTPTHL